jgi:hypothetical protein
MLLSGRFRKPMHVDGRLLAGWSDEDEPQRQLHHSPRQLGPRAVHVLRDVG